MIISIIHHSPLPWLNLLDAYCFNFCPSFVCLHQFLHFLIPNGWQLQVQKLFVSWKWVPELVSGFSRNWFPFFTGICFRFIFWKNFTGIGFRPVTECDSGIVLYRQLIPVVYFTGIQFRQVSKSKYQIRGIFGILGACWVQPLICWVQGSKVALGTSSLLGWA